MMLIVFVYTQAESDKVVQATNQSLLSSVKRHDDDESHPSLLHVSVNIVDSKECVFSQDTLVPSSILSSASTSSTEVINLCDEGDDKDDDSDDGESKTESKYGDDSQHVQSISADVVGTSRTEAEIEKQKEFVTYCIENICSSRQVKTSFQFFESFRKSLKAAK